LGTVLAVGAVCVLLGLWIAVNGAIAINAVVGTLGNGGA
jgi:hypothetical protein